MADGTCGQRIGRAVRFEEYWMIRHIQAHSGVPFVWETVSLHMMIPIIQDVLYTNCLFDPCFEHLLDVLFPVIIIMNSWILERA